VRIGESQKWLNSPRSGGSRGSFHPSCQGGVWGVGGGEPGPGHWCQPAARLQGRRDRPAIGESPLAGPPTARVAAPSSPGSPASAASALRCRTHGGQGVLTPSCPSIPESSARLSPSPKVLPGDRGLEKLGLCGC